MKRVVSLEPMTTIYLRYMNKNQLQKITALLLDMYSTVMTTNLGFAIVENRSTPCANDVILHIN